MLTDTTTDGALLDPSDDLVGRVTRWAGEVTELDDPVGATLGQLPGLGREAPRPGSGDTLRLFDLLSRVAAVDLVVARTVEPHLDALSILDQAPQPPNLDAIGVGPSATWGVFAAEGPGVRVTATRRGDGWTVSGHKPWSSLGRRLTHALVTAWTGERTRRLFAVPLRHEGVAVESSDRWIARGMALIPSVGIDLTDVPAVPVGEDGWYLTRPGFWWGAVGVAACWYGGATAVAELLHPRPGREPDQVALMHLGEADTALFAARTALQHAAAQIDTSGQGAAGRSTELLARRVRGLVRQVGDDVLARTSRATGPGPLVSQERHARRVADLHLYLRQEHAERDAAALGQALQQQDGAS